MDVTPKFKPLVGGKQLVAGEHGMNVTAGVTIDHTQVPINGELKRIIEAGTAIVKDVAKNMYYPYNTSKLSEKFDGDGIKTKFDLVAEVTDEDNVEVLVDGVAKKAYVDFIRSRAVVEGKYVASVELAAAPGVGVENVEVIITPVPVEPLVALHTEDCTGEDKSIAATHHNKLYEAACVGVDAYFKKHTPMIVYLRANVNQTT